MILIVVILIKYMVYVVWCAEGNRWAGPEPVAAADWETGRFAAGVAMLVGCVGFYGLLMVSQTYRVLLSDRYFFACLAGVRWFEWAAVEPFISGERLSLKSLLVGHQGTRMWRFLSVGVSALTDLPMVVLGGLGRL